MEDNKNGLANKYKVPAIVNTFDILKILSRKKFQESTLTEIAKAVNLTPATCYRILQQLRELSIVRFDNKKKKYTLGPYLVVLGERAKEGLDYISICAPFLESLTKDTGLTSVLISRVDDDRLTHIAKNEGDDFGIKVSIGRHFSILDEGSYGKCFLAFMNEDERDQFLKRHNRYDEDLKQLEDFKTKGYVVNYSEDHKGKFPGIFGVSSPIFLEDNNIELCISVIGMTAQFNKEVVQNTIGPKVKDTADKINKELQGSM